MPHLGLLLHLIITVTEGSHSDHYGHYVANQMWLRKYITGGKVLFALTLNEGEEGTCSYNLLGN